MNGTVSIRLFEPLPGADAAKRRKADPTGAAGTTLEHYELRETLWQLLEANPAGMTNDEITDGDPEYTPALREVLDQEVARGAFGRDGDRYTWIPLDQREPRPSEGSERDIDTEILAALGDASEPMDLDQLQAVTRVRKDHLSARYLPKLIKRGLVREVTKGGKGRGNKATYELAPESGENNPPRNTP